MYRLPYILYQDNKLKKTYKIRYKKKNKSETVCTLHCFTTLITKLLPTLFYMISKLVPSIGCAQCTHQ